MDGVADELHIQFPWGSLLKGVAKGDETVLRNLRRICANRASLEVIIGLDPNRDRSEVKRLELPDLSASYFESELVPKYRSFGFELVDYGTLSSPTWPQIESSWAKRLRQSETRILIYLRARAI